MNDKIAAPIDVEQAVRDNLLKAQKESDYRQVAHRDPRRWCEIATLLMNGASGLEIRQKIGGNHRTIKKIEAQLSEQLGEIAHLKAQEVQVLTSQNDELMGAHYDRLAEKLGAGEDLTDEQARVVKNLADAGVKLSHRVDRLLGRADVVVEQRVISDSDLQDTASAARARLAEMKKADIVEIEVID